ncbi:MAG TPA: filamentous hemagglutinin, partial [Oxalobacteraceae bacterium]|nr:filamentous hemagglutinin [Oxalobacteraceae bacterium]
QDEVTQHNQQTNAGVRVQVAIGTAWDVSGNASQSKGDGKSSTVNQQSGLFAGDGGYHVTADTIDLKGGAIAGTNAANSDLTTKAITFQDIGNKVDYQANGVSVAGGFKIGGGADGNSAPTQTSAGASNPNLSAGLPMQDKGSTSSTTYATLTDGKLTIGGQSLTSAKDLGAHTDLQTANKTIASLPNLKAIIGDQQAMAAAAGTVIATAKQVAGDIAGKAAKTQKDAQAVLDNPNSSPDQVTQAKLALIDAKQTQ